MMTCHASLLHLYRDASKMSYEFWTGETGGVVSVLVYRADEGMGFYTIEVVTN